jgi:epsilon-lactone hydrolase
MVSIRARAVRALIKVGSKPARKMSLEERRERIDHFAGRFRPPHGTLVTPVEEPGVRGEWISARRSRDDRVVLYLHGGAFCLGSLASHRNLVAYICAQGGARAFSLDYRLAPEHPFPAALDDTIAGYRYLLKLGIHPSRIAMAGDSAGGNLVLAAALQLRDAGEPLPAAIVCISPPTDFTASSKSLVSRAKMDPLVSLELVVPLCRAYAGELNPSDPRLSPLSGDLHGLPPLLIQVGTHEILHDDSVRFAAKAREAGVDVKLEVWDQLWHVWHAAVPYVPESLKAIRRIGQFLRERIPDAPAAASARKRAATRTARGGQ